MFWQELFLVICLLSRHVSVYNPAFLNFCPGSYRLSAPMPRLSKKLRNTGYVTFGTWQFRYKGVDTFGTWRLRYIWHPFRYMCFLLYDFGTCEVPFRYIIMSISVHCKRTSLFLANVNVSSRSLYAIARPSVVGNTRAPYSADCNFRQYFYGLGTLAICWHPLKISRRSSHGNPSAGGVKHNRGSKI